MKNVMRIAVVFLLPILFGGCLLETRYVYREEIVVPESPDTPISLSYEDLLPPTRPIIAPLRLMEIDYDIWPYVTVRRPWIRVEYWPLAPSIILYRYPSIIYTDFIFLPYYPSYYFFDDPDYPVIYGTKYRVDFYMGGSIGVSPWGDAYICYPLGSSFNYSYYYNKPLSSAASVQITVSQPKGDKSSIRYKPSEGSYSTSSAKGREEVVAPLQIPRGSLEKQKSYTRTKEVNASPESGGEKRSYYIIRSSTEREQEEAKSSIIYNVRSESTKSSREPSSSARSYYEGKKGKESSEGISSSGSSSSSSEDEDSKEEEGKAKKYYYRKKR
jgi:hypothetical protein